MLPAISAALATSIHPPPPASTRLHPPPPTSTHPHPPQHPGPAAWPQFTHFPSSLRFQCTEARVATAPSVTNAAAPDPDLWLRGDAVPSDLESGSGSSSGGRSWAPSCRARKSLPRKTLQVLQDAPNLHTAFTHAHSLMLTLSHTRSPHTGPTAIFESPQNGPGSLCFYLNFSPLSSFLTHSFLVAC